MELSQPLAARTGNAPAAATAVHSSPSIGQLAILTNSMPSLVHAHRQASLLGYGANPHAVSHTTNGTNQCPFMAAAGYGHGGSTGGSSGVVAGSNYPLPRHHQTSLQSCSNDRSHMYSYLGSSGSPTSGNNNGQLFLSSAPQSCSSRHHQFQPDTSSNNTATMSNQPSSQASSYYDAAAAYALDMSLLQVAAAAAVSTGASPPSGVSRNNNFSGRLISDQLEATSVQNRQFHQHQQQALATHARRTALSAATAALHNPSGRLLSPPLSVEELALDASTLEQALGNTSNSSARLFNPFDNDETLLQQDVRTEPDVLNREASYSSNMSPSLPMGISATANLGALSFSNVTVAGTNSTVRNGRVAASRKTNTRSSTRARKAQESKTTTGTKRGSQEAQLEAPQETVGCSRRNRTTTTTGVTLHHGASTSGISSKNPDSVGSTLPPENSTAEDKKKPAVKRSKKEDKLNNTPSVIKAEEENICCICMDVCGKFELASINSCKHKFCFTCIEKWADRENTCPLCKERFTKIERVHKPPSRKRKGDNSSATPTRQRNTKRVKNRSQRSDFISSNAFQGLLASMQGGPFPESVAQFIFSSIPARNRIVSLTRGSASSRPVVGSGSARVFSTGGSAPFTDLTISPTQTSTNNATQQGSTRPSSTASAAASSVQGALEVRRVRNFDGNSGGLPNQMMFRNTDFFDPNGPPNRLRSSRRPVVIDSDAESDADVEEVNMFIQHIRSIANRDAAASSAQSFHAGPPGESVRTHGPINNVPSLSYGVTSRSTPPRSYAINVHERDAGATADNALEILDSDDDDDDVIEILMRAQA